jgi:hypothetical protein
VPFSLEGVLLPRAACFTASFSVNSEISVILGAHNINKNEPTQQIIKTEKTFVHPKFQYLSGFYDIMLLKVPLFLLHCLSLPILTLLQAQAFKFFLLQIISSEPTTEFPRGMAPRPSILHYFDISSLLPPTATKESRVEF